MQQNLTHLIGDYVSRLVETFRPQAVVLFGSQATGMTHRDSDVDLLVLMDHDKRRDVDQEIEIDCALPRTFPMDIIVRKPDDFRRRIAGKDMALITLWESGKKLYERQPLYA
jgi:predicted nucleotidyltransferase